MILIYGNGQFLKSQTDSIDWSVVSAIVDKNASSNEKYQEVDVILPEQINQYSYHSIFIFIFTSSVLEEIIYELIHIYQIPKVLISPWYRLYINPENIFTRELDFFNKSVNTNQINSILDLNCPNLSNYYLTSSNLTHNWKINIDGFFQGVDQQSNISPIFYRDIYFSINELKKNYDLALITDWNDTVDIAYSVLGNSFKHTLVYINYDMSYDGSWQKKRLRIYNAIKKHATLKTYFSEHGLILLGKRKPIHPINLDLSIFVVLHKSYNVPSSDLYHPLCVGNYFHPEYHSEQQGENVAHLNPVINECTGIYWIWKNTNSTYVGLNHYRRYFYNDDLHFKENILEKETAYEYLKSYDLILAKSDPFETSVLEQLKGTIEDKSLFDHIYEKFRTEISTYQKDYVSSFDQVMNGFNFFRCNLFITKRSIFNEYCEWLFSFLLPIANNTDLSDYQGTIDGRIIGYFAERMLTVWLFKQSYSIVELPYTIDD